MTFILVSFHYVIPQYQRLLKFHWLTIKTFIFLLMYTPAEVKLCFMYLLRPTQKTHRIFLKILLKYSWFNTSHSYSRKKRNPTSLDGSSRVWLDMAFTTSAHIPKAVQWPNPMSMAHRIYLVLQGGGKGTIGNYNGICHNPTLVTKLPSFPQVCRIHSFF